MLSAKKAMGTAGAGDGRADGDGGSGEGACRSGQSKGGMAMGSVLAQEKEVLWW